MINKIKNEKDLLVINEDYLEILDKESIMVDWYEFDKLRVDVEKDRDEDLYQTQLQTFRSTNLSLKTPSFEQKQQISSLESEIISSETNFLNDPETYEDPNNLSTIEILFPIKYFEKKYNIQDFTKIFLSRYKFLENILRKRIELKNVTSINRILGKNEKEQVSLIVLVKEIRETKSKNILLTLEDVTGNINALVSTNKKELFGLCKSLVVDEVIGIVGNYSNDFIFVDDIIWPDIPLNRPLKKSSEEEYIVFLSDIHVGSKYFLEKEFIKFLKWIRGEVGNEEQREISRKIRYVFIAGDLVDGIGIYPSQEKELDLLSIHSQYESFTNLIKKIPLDKQIIICPGNHDVVHLAEPQPAFNREFAPALFELPNVTLVTNPATIRIGKTDNFEGFVILMYHGYSFDYYVANVDAIRNGGGYHRADLIMQFLLKRRHLAPSFKSTPYLPLDVEDPLLIKTVPDFFVSGHIHYSSVANYRGVTMISGSCWQAKTEFQQKLGHEPEPGRVPVVNLKTREIKVLRFI